MNLVQLDISAIKQSDSQNNAYVLLLNETVGKRQLPIVIGWCEARSIAIALEGNNENDRPLTHDLFKTMGDKFNIIVQKIIIHTLIEGIFHIKSLSKRDKIYNLTPIDTGVKVKWIAELFINNLSPKTVPVYENSDKGWQGDVPNYFYCSEKMLETGWKPKLSSEQAIIKTLDEVLKTR